MGAFGLFTLFGVYRLVRTITAIPTPSDGLRLKIDCTAILPGLRPRSVIVPYNHPILSSTFHTPPIKLSLAEQVELYKQQEVQREIERSRILTLPFRQASYWTYRGFRAAKKTWSKEGFIYMRVMGYNLAWKIDREAAWALEDGKAIDRLVRHV
ncbi:MAG: hypothetical protein MMC33_005210 [Icmadophila ericetorum]|nr:hypothetical protein [Icmadophila ericetorum]